MHTPNILLHAKRQIAFEELVRQEAEKFVTRTKGKKALDKAKEYGISIVAPNLVGAIIGYAAGGPKGAVEGMKEISVTALPYILLFQGIQDLSKRKLPLDNINYVMGQIRNNVTQFLQYVQSRTTVATATAIQAAMPAAGFYGISLLTEKVTGMNIDQGLVAGAGAVLGLIKSAMLHHTGISWQNKITTFADQHVDEIEAKKGSRLDLSGLEGIVGFAYSDPQKASQIYVASSEKRFRGVGGALGFLGALDELADKDRDSTRVRPNVTLNMKSEGMGYREYPQFEFMQYRDTSKHDAVLDLAKLINARSNGVQVKVHPIFSEAPLEDLLQNPYEQISAMYLTGEKDGKEYFEINYSFDEEGDKVRLNVYSGDHLDLVLDIFKQVYGRALKDVDFDSELVELSKNPTRRPKSRREQIVTDYYKGLNDRATATSEIGVIQKEDLLEQMHPRRKQFFGFGSARPKSKVPETPEQPLESIDSLAKIVLEAYNREKDKIMPSEGFPALNIAFQGVVYSITPMDYDEKDVKKTKALQFAASPIQSLGALIREREVLPSLRQAEVAAQIEGITKKNMYEVIRVLQGKIKGLKVEPGMRTISYDEFWSLSSNPQAVIDNSYGIEVIDPKGNKIHFYCREPKRSYASLREEYFPDHKVVAQRAEEAAQARQAKNFAKLGVRGMMRKTHFEEELEQPSYNIVGSKEDMPVHTLMYRKDDDLKFMSNSTVSVTTRNLLFLDTPVHPKEGIMTITKYLSFIRDAVKEVNSNNS